MTQSTPEISKSTLQFLGGKHLPFVDGKFQAIGNKSFKVDDSATGNVVADVLDGGAEAIDG